MKRLLLQMICVLFFSFAASAGVRNERIASYAFNAPDRVANDKQTLARYLTRPYRNDYDKLQSIAYWIASHIAYDGYKYNDGEASEREMQYKYDVLQYRTGICGDFAQLFSELAQMANISGVESVRGYVLENQDRIKRFYTTRDVRKEYGHAWNRVTLGKQKFFVDTTFMTGAYIGNRGIKPGATSQHKYDVRSRKRQNNVNTNIRDFFFDFTPKEEVKEQKIIHLMDKFIR
ncbi:MAG: transglutaminase domain-containing protein [Alphaproteobacteria bacterium]|nr:transglutaminase domain-containing protein [Alphaproteobacteria bacterium]